MNLSDLPVLTGKGLKFSNISPDNTAPGNIVPCLLCGKPFIMPFFVGEPDQVCGECMRTYRDTAKVVCAKCKVTICRVLPKLLDNGYYVKPNSILHSTECGVCNPNIRVSKLIEIEEWERVARRGKIIVNMS